MMNDLHQQVEYEVMLYCDYQLVVHLTENPVFHSRTKHVEIHYHLIREKLLQQEIEMRLIKIDKQVADLFIEGLSTCKFESFQHHFNVVKTRDI